jgi:PAS domain S-box-containing protein
MLRMERARWSELFDGPPLQLAVRVALAERIVRFTVKPLWFAMLAGVISVLWTRGLSEPTRFLPPAVATGALLRVTVYMRRSQWLLAARWLGATMLAAILAGVVLNSVLAPIYPGGLVLLAFVISLFGARWGLATGAALVIGGALWFALHLAGWSAGPLVAAPVSYLVMYSAYVAFALFVHCGTQRLLGDALEAAERERRQAEQARRAEAASELAFHAVFDQAGMAMVLLTAAGTIAQLNHRAHRWLGESQQALICRPLDDAVIWNEDQRDLLRTAVAAAAAGCSSQHELEIQRPGGARQVYQLQFTPFHDRQGDLGHVIVEVVELTEHIATRAMLAQARRLEALGKLSGGVAHDINNMLAAILGGSEVARAGRQIGDGSRIETGLDVIDSSVLRASGLIKQLLAFGRQDRFQSADVDVNRLVRDMGQLFEHTLAKGISIKLMACDEPAIVRGDVAALENALLNLALNAQDAMPDGGTLTIQVTKLPDEKRAPQPLAPGAVVVIRVGDTGSGMTERVRERMFEPFFTTKPAGKGTGLGLAAVHGTMRSHQGTIAVNSQIGVGTHIELFMPAIASERLSKSELPVPEPPQLPSFRARVLLADDEPLLRDVLVAMLQSANCEVQAVSDGEALLDALAAGATPDVIVTDLVMPGIGGTHLLHMLEASQPACPLVLITGYAGEDVSVGLSRRTRHRLLRKPFQHAELMAAIAELLPARLQQRRVDTASSA